MTPNVYYAQSLTLAALSAVAGAVYGWAGVLGVVSAITATEMGCRLYEWWRS